MSDDRRSGDGGLAADLLELADRPDAGATPPWAAIGEIVRRTEAMKARGALTADAFAALRLRAMELVADMPEYRQAEALMSLDALDPRRGE
ncbi:hypothetical protein [Sorangium sp. So ce1024]|uniref:hypothetical protein n=1 Tax=Sorangium sp. So ce1024 TaxID=3133327 RepID=UPI003F045781